jgi:Tfp pilus assembly protein PilO
MSQPLSADKKSARTELFRRQIAQFRGARRQGIFGISELVGLAFSLLLLLAVLVGYFYFLVPAQSRLDFQQRERSRLQTLLRTSSVAMQKENDTQLIVEKITGSIDEFETGHLSQQAQGRMDLYEELNQLMKKNNLSNTSGPTYTSLESITVRTSNRSTSAKWQSVYPGVAVAVTVEGQYQNLRRFVRDLEHSEQFIIINGVELERAETNSSVSVDPATAGARGSLVSLRLDLATYFQRNASSDSPQTVSVPK